MKIIYFLSACFINLAVFGEVKAAPQISSHKKGTTIQGKLTKLPEPNTFFTGRKQEIEAIAQQLFQENKNVLAIEGISGIGKTQLAKKYAHSYSEKYDVLWWFDSEADMDTQIDHFLKELSFWKTQPYYRPISSEDLIQKLKKELTDLKGSWLLVFDNMEDVSLLHDYVSLKINDVFAKHVIITSKKMNKEFPSMILYKFQRQESLDFLSKILEDANKKEFSTLAEVLEDFPLALVQACSYIKMNSSIDIQTYIQLFKENYSELWGSEKKLFEHKKGNQLLSDHYNKTISTAIKVNIDAIKMSDPFAYKILAVCSLLNHQRIPLPILEHWAYTKQRVSKVEFHEALSNLLNYFLLEEEKNLREKQRSKLFNQHELVQLITKNILDLGQQKAIIKDASESLLQTLLNSPGTLQEQYRGKEHYYSHIEKLYSLAKRLGYKDDKITELKSALLYIIHFIQHDFNRSAEMIKKFQNFDRKRNSFSPLVKVWLYCTFVNDQIYENFSNVEKNYKKALENLEKIQDAETRNSYLLHLNIDYADALSNFGRLREAVSFCENSREILELSKNKSQKISFLGMAALIHLRYGQYEQCTKDLDSCFDLISKQKDAEKYIPFLRLIKAHCLLYQGHAREAHRIVEETYPHLLEAFADTECNVLVKAQLVKGGALVSLERLEEALNIVQSSINSYENTSGFDNDALKGMGYRILGEIFEAKGDLAKAYDEYMKAEKLYDRILQEKSLDDLSRLYTRLALLGAKLGDDSMANKYLSLQIENFGLAHPRTFEIKHFLDQEGLSLP